MLSEGDCDAASDRMNVHIDDIAAVALAGMAAGIAAGASLFRRSPRAFSAIRRRRPLQWRSPPCGLGLASIPGPGMGFFAVSSPPPGEIILRPWLAITL